MGSFDVPGLLIVLGLVGLLGLGVHNWKYHHVHPHR
jgi:hypothetical protein